MPFDIAVLILRIFSTIFILSLAVPLSALGMTGRSWVYAVIGAMLTLWAVWS